jgi:hypothetical protein
MMSINKNYCSNIILLGEIQVKKKKPKKKFIKKSFRKVNNINRKNKK